MDLEYQLRKIVDDYYNLDSPPPVNFAQWVQCTGIGTYVHPCTHYIDKWLEIGHKNPWISEASDPPFSRKSFVVCNSVEELYIFIWHGNWSLGTAFILGDLCFINQVDGGDEYLTIKQDLPFESASLLAMIRADGFFNFIERIQKATLEQCKRLEY